MEQLDFLDRIKRLVIIAMFSDDELMEKLVLKGGNLLDVVLGVSTRGSVDLDFSIENEFESLEFLRTKIENALKTMFHEEGFVVFDINLREVPPNLTAALREFWGGYKVDFKIIEKGKYHEFKEDLQILRKRARSIGAGDSPKFKIDISKHEYCGSKCTLLLEDYTIYTYSPEMVVAEKIRAICQQMPEYAEVVNSHPSARARDFLDIHTVVEHFAIEFQADVFQEILKRTFEIKRVPLNFIDNISDFREYHRPDFLAVRETVKPGVALRGFDFYFDYVISKCRSLKPLWDV